MLAFRVVALVDFKVGEVQGSFGVGTLIFLFLADGEMEKKVLLAQKIDT